MMRITKTFFYCLFILSCFQLSAQTKMSGNPVFKGWYADPEGAIFNHQYWIYPTYSAPYNQQVFMDAYSSTDLPIGKSIHISLIHLQSNGQGVPCGHLPLQRK